VAEPDKLQITRRNRKPRTENDTVRLAGNAHLSLLQKAQRPGRNRHHRDSKGAQGSRNHLNPIFKPATHMSFNKTTQKHSLSKLCPIYWIIFMYPLSESYFSEVSRFIKNYIQGYHQNHSFDRTRRRWRNIYFRMIWMGYCLLFLLQVVDVLESRFELQLAERGMASLPCGTILWRTEV